MSMTSMSSNASPLLVIADLALGASKSCSGCVESDGRYSGCLWAASFSQQGHMIPIIDLARLLATRGAFVTVITTPVNAARISPIIVRAEQSGLPIRFVSLQFPTAEVGLPEGMENVDMLPSSDLLKNFFDACCMLRDPLINYLRNHGPPPTCIISDHIQYWTKDVAEELDIKRLIFYGFGSFPLLCLRNIRDYQISEKVEDENEPFLIPGVPDSIEITGAQVPLSFSSPSMQEHRERGKEAELTCDSFVLNTFQGLEPLYPEWCEKALGKKVWTIGPVALSNTNIDDMASRGNKASIDEDRCRNWLDTMKPRSVIFVSFGSLARTLPSQLIELGLGLEASNSPFIWVIKAGERLSELEEWLSAFEERTRDRGLIIRGWAPQLMILSHSAVGGFMTHCGWNSTLESVSFGVPLITWPHFGDQFVNEKLVVEVLRIGVSVGVKAATKWGVEVTDVLVKKEDVEKAIQKLFDEGEEGKERRKRVKEFREMAQKAVEEGGSSHDNILQLIKYVNAVDQIKKC